MKIKTSIIAILLSITLIGCSTFQTNKYSNHLISENDGDYEPRESKCILATPHIYSGTVVAFERLLYPLMCDYSGKRPFLDSAALVFALPYLVLDLSMSVVADTVLLPYTSFKQVKYGNIERPHESD